MQQWCQEWLLHLQGMERTKYCDYFPLSLIHVFLIIIFLTLLWKESKRLFHCWSVESQGVLSLLVFDIDTWEALILITLVRKSLASSPQMNRKYAALHSNLIKPIPQPIPLKFSSDEPLIYWVKDNIYAIQHLDAWFNFGVHSTKRHVETGENSAEGHWDGQEKYLTYEQKLRNLGLICPEKGRAGNVITANQVTNQGNSMNFSS